MSKSRLLIAVALTAGLSLAGSVHASDLTVLVTPEQQAQLRAAAEQARQVAREEADRARELAKQLKPQLNALAKKELNDPNVKDVEKDLETLQRDLQALNHKHRDQGLDDDAAPDGLN